jgi:hypothetical protein
MGKTWRQTGPAKWYVGLGVREDETRPEEFQRRANQHIAA